MRLYASIRVPFLRSLSRRIGFITFSARCPSRYNAHAIDSTTLLPQHFNWPAFWFGVLLGLAGLAALANAL